MANNKPWSHGSSAGYNRRRCRCEACVAWAREYYLALRNKRRSTWLAEHGPCAGCGSWDDLELDHIDPDSKDRALLGKDGSNQDIWKWPKARREAELAKCQVLCRECHLKKCAEEMRERHALGLHPKVTPPTRRSA